MNIYFGNNGYSIKLNGCDKGCIYKALQRNIVLLGAVYKCNEFTK